MSRSRHARPATTSGDEMSRVRNAATGLADTYIRFDRYVSRLQRMLDDARAAGISEDDLVRAVQLAGSGRPDRTKALNEVFDRIRAHGDFPLERDEPSRGLSRQDGAA